MSDRVYVVPYGTRWKVECEHCDDQVATTQTEALRKARAHVAALPKGTIAQISVQRPDRQFRVEWTYGKDPFPPAG